MRTRYRLAGGLVAGVLAFTACSTAPGQGPGPGGAGVAGLKVIRVIAAENVWGSIAEQLGGSRVTVTSIIDSPDVDPHAYEPTAADSRAIAAADLVLINGVGYDTWASRLAAANPDPKRIELTVGELVGVPSGGNPHRWYNPDDVLRVIEQIVADYKKIDPAGAAYFDSQKKTFENVGLADYKAVIAQIRATFAGVAVGASESIFAMVAPALGLRLLTPPDFLQAISEGTDPTAADKAVIDAQLTGRKIEVYIYNSQNATPDIQTQIDEARAQGISVTTITETMTPASASWQQWQTGQLVALRDALATAARR